VKKTKDQVEKSKKSKITARKDCENLIKAECERNIASKKYQAETPSRESPMWHRSTEK